MEANELREALDKLKGQLDSHLDEKVSKETNPLRKDLDATIKALDTLQIRLKNPLPAQHAEQPTSFAGELRQEIFNHTDDFRKLQNREIKSFKFELKDVGDMGTANLTGGTRSISPQLGIVPSDRRGRYVRDFLRIGTMEGSYLPILQDNGGEGSPAPTAEKQLKPQVDYDLKENSVQAQTIAGWVRFSKQFLDDVPNAQNWLTNKLTESYMIAEDSQLLTGNGTSPNLSGLNNTGNFTAASPTDVADTPISKLIQGILQLRALGKAPTGIIINPADYAGLLLNVSSGSGVFDLPSYVSVSAFGQLSILGVPVLDTPSQGSQVYTIIDNNGSLLAVRQNITVEFFEQDSTNVRENMVTARVEARIALATYAATYNVKGSFATT